MTIDIGGEGRHPHAWNVNPSPCRTLGPQRGQPIPRRIAARADCLPLPSRSVRHVIVERTPLTAAALAEIARVIAPGGTVTLRHVPLVHRDRHALARQRLAAARVQQRWCQIGGQIVLETQFQFGRSA
jgi:hypothetical protein